MSTKVSVGRIVHYRLTSEDAEAINRRREHAKANLEKMREEKPGFQAHIGNRVSRGEIVPLQVTNVWEGNRVNGQATLDGNDSLWVTSADQGVLNGQWFWPERVE